MKVIGFIGNSSAIIIIGTIVIFGILEKKDVFDLFIKRSSVWWKTNDRAFPNSNRTVCSSRNA